MGGSQLISNHCAAAEPGGWGHACRRTCIERTSCTGQQVGVGSIRLVSLSSTRGSCHGAAHGQL
ncbi:hypothetical protein HaLaN_10178 [Haematococcus lacustris]|uniref:Uncharacterized protein n=1 Tax=Haematococcus lacustris TaxID=44745 RepID=A0A699Z5H9_HAELA|nr:hypothetical protein HaLaN_10178 [Haematococcus lacustris]